MRSRRLCLFLALVIYTASYLGLSRRGYAEADRCNIHGFYYFAPEDTDAWRVKHFTCAALYAPANALDSELGTGRPPACEPLWRLGP
jgi:hypothetical protein